MDGAWNPSSGEAFCGGVDRDANMRWWFGISKKIDICSAFDVELWTVYEGLTTTWALSYSRVIIETYCKEIYDCLMVGVSERIHSSLRPHIISLLNKDWEVHFNWVSYQCNSMADKLAKMAKNLPMVYHRFMDPPSDILDLFNGDVDVDLSNGSR
ncbi:hypothetical protein V6N12_009939 [Hibiscus sabdariffa]|uniref:RNase H type-1 domain-containing protein n=1 Tax=Hibiscus sabdariffa TaxID=183260 RepID=A0ABR2ECM4_9ROSI